MHILRSLAGLLLITCWSSAASTVIAEQPWRADAAAYRLSAFYCALAPVPWDKIEAAWTQPLPKTDNLSSARDVLSQWTATDRLWTEIQQAIDTQNAQQLYESSTRTIARALLSALQRAGRLNISGEDFSQSNPATDLAIARAYFRAFENDIRRYDPAAYRDLGLAWLEMSNSIGSRGVVGQGAVAGDKAVFLSAYEVIRKYIEENYDPANFIARSRCETYPETALRAVFATSTPHENTSATLPPGSFIGDQSPLPLLVLNFEERGIEESDLPLVAYGDMLFDSPQIFGEPARSLGISCATCHNRSDVNQQFFIPGLSHQPGSVDVDSAFFNPIANDRRDDPIDIPTLRGLRFTGPYGRDGRIASLRDFTRTVIVKEFAGEEPTAFVLDALVAYLEEFDFLPNSRLSAAGELIGDVDESVRRGEALFKKPFAQMDGRACASCHIPDSNFQDHTRHVLGTVKESYAGARDGAMDTPTLLGSLYTAPYFHDGSVPTLEGVVSWFNEHFKLKLSDTERADLTAYLRVVGGADEPYEIFDQQNTPFKLLFSELTTFASTLDTLIPMQDQQHAMLLINTVTTDMTGDASLMQNLDARLEIYQLSDALRLVGVAIEDDDWSAAANYWTEFKEKLADVESKAY